MQPKNIVVRVLLCVAIFLLPTLGRQAPQENSFPNGIEYAQVVERAFQFSQRIPAEFREMQYRIVVRFLPSSGPESQVVLLGRSDRPIRLIEYRIRKGLPPISQEYNEVLHRNPKASIEEILNRTSVDRTEELAEESTTRLVAEFFRVSIPTKVSPSLCMDGATYELWVQTPSNEIHASLSDCAYGENTASTPIIQWVKAMQSEMQKRK